jgi:hypothetical protein
MADKPANRMRVDAVIFVLLFLLVSLLVFISLSPFLKPEDMCPRKTPGISAYLGPISRKYTTQSGEMSSPDVGIYVGIYGEDTKTPPGKYGRVHRIPCFAVRFGLTSFPVQ